MYGVVFRKEGIMRISARILSAVLSAAVAVTALSGCSRKEPGLESADTSNTASGATSGTTSNDGSTSTPGGGSTPHFATGEGLSMTGSGYEGEPGTGDFNYGEALQKSLLFYELQRRQRYERRLGRGAGSHGRAV